MKKLITFIIILIILVSISYAGFKISKSRDFQFFGGIVKQVKTDKKVVALTFDDGPTEMTNDVLNFLQKLDIKATFFVTGFELENNMVYAKKIVDAGHELGNHSYSHKRMVLKSPSFIKNEITKTDDLIRQAGYKGEIHFRPPYFKKLFVLPYYLKQQNKKTILCDVEPETVLGYKADAKSISEYTIDNVKEGSIILIHVMYNEEKEGIKSLESIVNDLKGKGYRFLTVSELLEYNK